MTDKVVEHAETGSDRIVSPFGILEAHARRAPAEEAIWAGQTRVTYPEFVDRVAGYAGSLLRDGFTPGAVTGVAIRDEISHLTCAMALLCLGSPQVALPAHELATNKRAIARRLGVTQLVAQEPSEWMDGLKVFLSPGDQTVVARSRGTSRHEHSLRTQCLPDRIALYRNTSGSTNIPKTFGLSLENLLVQAERMANEPAQQRVLRTSTVEHDATRFHRICALLAGASCIFGFDMDLKMLPSLCAHARVSSIHIGTYKLASLLAGDQKTQRLPAFTQILTGGARVPGALRDRVLSALTDDLWVSYATSEIGTVSLAAPDQHQEFPEGVGFPLEGVTVEIVDADGVAVAPGEIGRVRVRKRAQPRDYVDDPKASARFADGWFYPGDLLSRPPGGPLIFHSRADDVIILNGINVYPSAIEDVLEAHPGVSEAAAFPIKSRLHGDIPAAAIILAAAATDREPLHFLDYCRQALGVRAPRHIVIVEAIPRNDAGKPLRRALSAMIAST